MSFQIGGVSSTGEILSWGGRSAWLLTKINAVDVVCDRSVHFRKLLFWGISGIDFLRKGFVLGLLLLGICGFWLYWWSPAHLPQLLCPYEGRLFTTVLY